MNQEMQIAAPPAFGPLSIPGADAAYIARTTTSWPRAATSAGSTSTPRSRPIRSSQATLSCWAISWWWRSASGTTNGSRWGCANPGAWRSEPSTTPGSENADPTGLPVCWWARRLTRGAGGAATSARRCRRSYWPTSLVTGCGPRSSPSSSDLRWHPTAMYYPSKSRRPVSIRRAP